MICRRVSYSDRLFEFGIRESMLKSGKKFHIKQKMSVVNFDS